MAQSTGPDTGPQDGQGGAREVASVTAGRSREAAGAVAGTAREQAGHVVEEAWSQARGVAEQMRARLGSEAQAQVDHAAGEVREWAEELAGMAERAERDSSARALVRQVAEGSRRAADSLQEQGLGGVVAQVDEFARRRPGAFLATVMVAGFVAGRAGRAVKGQSSGEPDARGDGGPRPAGEGGR